MSIKMRENMILYKLSVQLAFQKTL